MPVAHQALAAEHPGQYPPLSIRGAPYCGRAVPSYMNVIGFGPPM
jgi:hypothetical protein